MADAAAIANLGLTAGVQSDVVIIQSDVKAINSDVKVLDPLIDTIKSDTIIIQSDVKTINSDIKVLDPLINTIKSDVIVVQPKITSILSDTVVLTARPSASPPIMMQYGVCDAGMAASKTAIVSDDIIGYGNDFFNGKYYLGVLRNANSAGAAPEYEWRLITDYTSTTGAFTTLAFSANVEEADAILVLHESLFHNKDSLVFYGKCDADMGASTTAIVIKSLAGFGDDYFNTNWWMKVVKNANSVGASPETNIRQITDYTSATGAFTCSAFAANVEAIDEVLILHDSLPFSKCTELLTGSGNWTVPVGTYFIDVLLVGGGGGGGGVTTTSGNASGGGGGGEVVMVVGAKVTPGSVIAYSVGAAGTEGASGDNNGGSGGNTTFGPVTAYGGLGGSKGTVRTGGNGGQTTVTGGAGGAADNAGVIGVAGGTVVIARFGGGGGGGGRQASAGGAGAAGFFGLGGTVAAWSGGGGGSYGAGANAPSNNLTGVSASANTGGGGSGCATGANAYAGGAGGSGYICIVKKG